MGYVGGSSNSRVRIGDQDISNITWEDNFSYYQEMVFDATKPEFGMYS